MLQITNIFKERKEWSIFIYPLTNVIVDSAHSRLLSLLATPMMIEVPMPPHQARPPPSPPLLPQDHEQEQGGGWLTSLTSSWLWLGCEGARVGPLVVSRSLGQGGCGCCSLVVTETRKKEWIFVCARACKYYLTNLALLDRANTSSLSFAGSAAMLPVSFRRQKSLHSCLHWYPYFCLHSCLASSLLVHLSYRMQDKLQRAETSAVPDFLWRCSWSSHWLTWKVSED